MALAGANCPTFVDAGERRTLQLPSLPSQLLSPAVTARAISRGRQPLATAAREYELTVSLNPQIGDDVINTNLAWLQQTITSRGGEIVQTDHWGRRRLAYPVRR